MAGETMTPALRARVESLDPGSPLDYRELAVLLVATWKDEAGPRRVGLAGGQGTGKSTLARLLDQASAGIGLRACVLALDDYYLPRADRLVLARRVHPLFETRGPPGTHDVERLRADLEALAGPAAVEVPVFDKGRDDRVGVRKLVGPFDLVVLEGWCIGALAQPAEALLSPCNDLERDEDPDGRWRCYVNQALSRSYSALFALLDAIVFLRAPDMACVRRWRLEQEAERPPGQRMDAATVARFVAHYERITRDMRANLPGRAAWTIDLNADHSIEAIERRDPTGRHSR